AGSKIQGCVTSLAGVATLIGCQSRTASDLRIIRMKLVQAIIVGSEGPLGAGHAAKGVLDLDSIRVVGTGRKRSWRRVREIGGINDFWTCGQRYTHAVNEELGASGIHNRRTLVGSPEFEPIKRGVD